MIDRSSVMPQTIYYQYETTNQSFIDMYNYLRQTGRQNHSFFLVLYDPDLAGIDPRDPRLNSFMKQKVLRECLNNYWYYLREVVLIPQEGGAAGSGIRYKLHRGNLAMNYCIVFNLNIFAEFPRQHGKTIGIVCRTLYEYQFGTTNSQMVFINKKFDDSKENLDRLKRIRDTLPEYLRFVDQNPKSRGSVEKIQHPMNGNRVTTLASARSKVQANGLGRGLTIPRIWYDEFAFIPYNDIIFLAAAPAFKRASLNAKSNGKPYGIIITTTPGDMTTEMGIYAYNMKENATKFQETWYDLSEQQINEIISNNRNSNMVYIRFTYQQLGSDEKWFAESCRDVQMDYNTIRREILLEWAASSDNSPFSKEELETVKALIKEPIRTMTICNLYTFEVYKDIDLRNPPIIGVDVSGGYQRDASAITVIDSLSTEVVACLNCNYINSRDLSMVIYTLVTKYMSNAVVNIERNGGFGAAVLSNLLSTSIKKNLYWEIKDRVVEDRVSNGMINKKTQKTKVYGLDNSKNTREKLIDLLRQRMEYHKDKFISHYIFEELQTLEVKKGRVDHSSNGHDDQIFSYLMALYVWYYGENLRENWHIVQKSLKTDEDAEQAIIPLEEKCQTIVNALAESTQQQTVVDEQIKYLNSTKVLSYEDWMLAENEKDEQAMKDLINTPLGKKAYMENYYATEDQLKDMTTNIPNSVFMGFNDSDEDDDYDGLF